MIMYYPFIVKEEKLFFKKSALARSKLQVCIGSWQPGARVKRYAARHGSVPCHVKTYKYFRV